jgi:hypothetical protein
VKANSGRAFLCSRCGAVVQYGATEGAGACPDCGLGFSVVTTGTFRRQAESEEDRATREQLDAARRREQAEVLYNRTFPVYGLDERWTGSRWFGGFGTHGTVDHIELAHGDPFDDAAPLVRVAAWRLAPPEELTVANAAHQLADYLWEDGGAPHDLVRPTFTSPDPTASWAEISLQVDRVTSVFRGLVHGPFWVALACTEHAIITVEARHIAREDFGLVTVENVDSYLLDIPSPP